MARLPAASAASIWLALVSAHPEIAFHGYFLQRFLSETAQNLGKYKRHPGSCRIFSINIDHIYPPHLAEILLCYAGQSPPWLHHLQPGH